MDEEDYEVLRNEARAEPERYHQWDAQERLRREYEERHRREEEHEEVASVSSSSSSSSSNASMSLGRMPTVSLRSRGNTLSSTLSRHPTETHPVALERIETQRSQHQGTVGQTITRRTTSRRERPLPNFGAGKPYPPLLPEREEYVVEFDGPDDPLHAQNWPMKRKLFIGAILAFDAIAATMGSSIFSPAIGAVSMQFGVIQEVGTLGISLFVFGYAFGPLFWAPMSELYGRRIPLIIGAFGFAIFSISTAVAKDLQTIMITRFFGGVFGSCPLACVAAVFADMFSNAQRGLAVAVFSCTVFMGPLLAPFIGGFITISYLGWRWTEYISAIMAFTAFILLLIFMKETYPPVVLVSKASELRRRTKNWGIHAKQEEIEVDFQELIVKNVSRPMRILFTEPIVLLITIYMSFIYGILYLFLTAYGLVFQGVYGWNEGVAGLPYFGMIIGEMIAFVIIVIDNPRYTKKLATNNNVPVPEWRLPISMVGSVLFAVGLFWFGWTGYSGSVHWIVPVLSGLFTGFGIFTIFLSLLNYIVDAYLMFAASAIAANTFMRSIFGGVFPLFATYMFNGMGIQWAATVLGCIAAVLIPMPVVFYLYGKKIRARSKFAPAPDIELDRKRDEESRMDGNGVPNGFVSGSQGEKGGEERSESGSGAASRTGGGTVDKTMSNKVE
ncbi:MFS general substrate transporter [Patellaria atrata CBS 101060]|uniref:MFS general substrate transporter n=1 Tax=Patellaria atrata CBS 101060 TaxID=1346257 RepID=A0A9P4SJK3_9PEZI|nr:MFS general substrate transporter [Patellaria atrata CBS 101060]